MRIVRVDGTLAPKLTRPEANRLVAAAKICKDIAELRPLADATVEAAARSEKGLAVLLAACGPEKKPAPKPAEPPKPAEKPAPKPGQTGGGK